MHKACAVILAGGRGQRFWPLSTRQRPKQMLSVVGGKPLVQCAIERLDGVVASDRIFIVTAAAHAEHIRSVCRNVPAENILGEPASRDTAAACTLAAAVIKARHSDSVVCILPADHVIGDVTCFHRTLRQAIQTALEWPVLVTIGLLPTCPSTGFGYIECGERTHEREGVEFHRVRRFVEKPNRDTAVQYMRAGNFYWNSGMFVWTVQTFSHALSRYHSRLSDMFSRLQSLADSPRFSGTLADWYASLDRISVDYAILEKADNILMARGTFPWQDVGSWASLASVISPDADGNVWTGTGEALASSNNIIVSRERPTMLLGVHDLIVVQAADVTLVCARDRAEDVKQLVQHLEQRGSYEAIL